MTRRRGFWVCLVWLTALFPAAARGQQVSPLCDFEEPAALEEWEFRSGAPRLVEEGATSGKRALEIVFDEKGAFQGAYLYWKKVRRDWSAFDALALDVLNPNAEPVPGYVLVADEAWADKGRTYWNRHNGHATFAPGRTEWLIPVRGLFRGEAGSRNNDIKRNIDPDAIVRVDLGFGGKGQSGRIVIDNLRLVKSDRPANVWAFDFGPASQAVMLGWMAVSPETRYSKDQGFGWGPFGGAPPAGVARDTTFATMLLQDFCEAGGYNFRVDAPPGRYRVLVFYENSGYWGGEQAMHGQRRILANGRSAWQEERPDGSMHALYRFEDVEPLQADIWDLYMKEELAKPAVFEAEAAADGLALRFEADRMWGSKVAGVVLYRLDDAASGDWVQQQLAKLAGEFRSKAVCLDAPAASLAVPAAWQRLGVIAWAVSIEEDVTPNSVPTAPAPRPEDFGFSRLAVRGEYEPFCLAVRPMRDLGECRLALTAADGPGPLKAVAQVVRYNTSRGFSSIAYRVMPHTLREQEAVLLQQGVTRQIVVTVKVPPDAPAGEYGWRLALKNAKGEEVLAVPLKLNVRPVTLERDTEFLMGFFGLTPPSLIPQERYWDVLEQTLALLRDHGMNAVSGGPSWQLKGWQNGEPVIDFADMDRFFSLLRKYGFERPLNGYGGARFQGLHTRYEKGTQGEEVERQSGLPYHEALLRAWRAVDAHARAAGWPTIFYAMCDETRVRETAERELSFMKMMADASKAFPRTLRTSGSYSVHFTERPADPNSLLHWHQRFFEALDISSLNLHDASTMAEAARLGKEIHIYNQGRSRYSFGLYQWSEFRKGVRARWQWHLNILHGYQFFDLDGREPDTAMICYGRKEIYPTVHFERCREGAEDFYLYQTLWNLAQRKRPQGEAAIRLLEDMVSQIQLNQRDAPEGYDPDALKARIIEAILALSAGR